VSTNPNRIPWTKEQVKLAFNLYCQLPFGKLHKGNKEIIELASLIGRTPSAVAMKLVNLASLDPAITNSGRSGLSNASALDKEVWSEFSADWDKLTVECLELHKQLKENTTLTKDKINNKLDSIDDYTGETRSVIIQQRIGQSFFRRAVLNSYDNKCCMSGLSDARLLVASHIVPWKSDQLNRLNPRNGLCLSAIHDKAFDRGLITLDENLCVTLSSELKQRDDKLVKQVFLPLSGKSITLPERFIPEESFLEIHRKEVFLH
jgi:predicted restriction endonuclease